MKVHDHRHPDTVDFEYLDIGDLFIYHPEDITGMKIEEVKSADSAHGRFNFVDVKDGTLGCFNDRDEVEPLPNAVISIH